jgi:hypothetical protein
LIDDRPEPSNETDRKGLTVAVEFPRTKIENLSVSRLIMGTNCWLGFSHTSQAKDKEIVATMTAERMAGIIEVFLRAGVDGMLGMPEGKLAKAIEMAQDRTGRKVVKFLTPTLNLSGAPGSDDENRRLIEKCRTLGCEVCMPHQGTTDALVDRVTHTIRGMDTYCRMIREAGMVPGLSTHMPESIIYADETNLDVGTYISIYNCAGFLMQVEVEWVQQVIHAAKKPVLTIKPMAAGRLTPLAGLAFAWNTLRDIDMVCVGTQTPDEAKEVIELSYAMIERRKPAVKLQRTRSKASIDAKG